VTWGEVEAYYAEHTEEIAQMPETYEIAGILVVPKVSEEAKRDAIERMTAIKDRLEAGEAFEDLAREHSDDASAELGGDLGYVTRGIMVSEFEEAVFALEVGEVSGIVPTRFGFHLIKVEDKEDDRVHARHILARVAPGPADDVLAQARAESLRQLVLAGDDFASVAYEYSDDPVSRERGGELGTFTVDGVAPAFGAVLFDLEVGEIAEVVRGDSGYYVLKLVAHEEPHLASLDEIREDLREFLFSIKAEEGYRELIDRLHGEIHIDIRTRMASEQ
jgi:peptidyl-prolyl cis-trans isomerase SurA